MGLNQQWQELAEKERSQPEYENFWKTYFEKEKNNYEAILEKHTNIFAGKFSDLAAKFNMDTVTFVGFIDGINTSLVEEIDVESLNEDSEVSLDINFEKLFFNMLDAKAEWLYTLPQWEVVLPEEKRDEITKEFRKSKIAISSKVGRNDSCPCGSGKKFKKCCGK